MDEFALIREVVRHLADRAQGPWVAVGPGDDAAVMQQSPAHDAVASIDTLVADVHFPASAPAFYVGYRALMVSLSDLAAMAAQPRYVLVALTLPAANVSWVGDLAKGMAAAARVCDTYICGGNFARGPLSITVSVHGEVPTGKAVTRAGACAGDKLYVSGPLGLAAACVRNQDYQVQDELNVLQRAYFMPEARFDLLGVLRSKAHAAIDISDGLLADARHLAEASGVGVDINSADLTLAEGVMLEDVLNGGDDYQLLATADVPLPGMMRIGQINSSTGVCLDGVVQQPAGYNHFVA